MKHLVNLSLVVSILWALGCGLKQDPLADKPDIIKNGRIPQQKIEPLRPENSEVIRIDTVNKFTFVENREDKITITSRVLAPGYVNEMTIDNLSDFQDATFDSVTGVFTWKPPKGFIFDGLSRALE